MRRGCLLLLAGPIAVAAVLLVALGMLIENWRDAPDRDAVAADLILGGELLAYEVLAGSPHVVFAHPGGRVVVDRLRPDLIARNWPPRPAWQLTGNWHAISRTNDAVSVGLTPCAGQPSGRFASEWPACSRRPIVFGQINAPAIVAIEIEYKGAWHRYPVSAPGYVVALAPFRGIPGGYRWLDANGAVIDERGPVPELRQR